MTSTADIFTMIHAELASGTLRSPEYRLGMFDYLQKRLNGVELPKPYKPGSPEFDAYYAGIERGRFAMPQTEHDGMMDFLRHQLNGAAFPTRYAPDSPEFRAYAAGVERARLAMTKETAR